MFFASTLLSADKSFDVHPMRDYLTFLDPVSLKNQLDPKYCLCVFAYLKSLFTSHL